MESLLNCTPHDIVVMPKLDTHDADKLLFLASEYTMRLTSAVQKELYKLSIIPVHEAQVFTGLEHLALPSETRAIIVSMPVGQYLAHYSKEHNVIGPYFNTTDKVDVYGPDLGPNSAIRDHKGRPIGTRRLVFYTRI